MSNSSGERAEQQTRREFVTSLVTSQTPSLELPNQPHSLLSPFSRRLLLKGVVALGFETALFVAPGLPQKKDEDDLFEWMEAGLRSQRPLLDSLFQVGTAEAAGYDSIVSSPTGAGFQFLPGGGKAVDKLWGVMRIPDVDPTGGDGYSTVYIGAGDKFGDPYAKLLLQVVVHVNVTGGVVTKSLGYDNLPSTSFIQLAGVTLNTGGRIGLALRRQAGNPNLVDLGAKNLDDKTLARTTVTRRESLAAAFAVLERGSGVNDFPRFRTPTDITGVDHFAANGITGSDPGSVLTEIDLDSLNSKNQPMLYKPGPYNGYTGTTNIHDAL